MKMLYSENYKGYQISVISVNGIDGVRFKSQIYPVDIVVPYNTYYDENITIEQKYWTKDDPIMVFDKDEVVKYMVYNLRGRVDEILNEKKLGINVEHQNK